MIAGETATGRPRQQVPFLARMFALIVVVLGALEGAVYLEREPEIVPPVLGPFVGNLFSPLRSHYLPPRSWVFAHPAASATVTILFVAAVVIGYRFWLLFWHNHVVARLSGTRFAPAVQTFPTRPVDVLSEIGRRPRNSFFVGMTPKRGMFGWRWRPVYISQRQRTMHRHVIGKTGSGKTSVRVQRNA